MSIFGGIGRLLGSAAPIAIGAATGGTLGAASSFVGQAAAKKKLQRPEGINIMQGDPIGNVGFTGTPISQNIVAASQPGFFSAGGAFRQGVRDFGGFLGGLAPVAGVLGLGDRFTRTNAGTAITLNSTAPGETSTSGEFNQAGLGGLAALLQGGRQLARSPAGQSALGFAGGALAGAFMDGQSGAPRITRRMKSDVRRIYTMAAMDPNVTAQILNNMGTYPRMNFDASLVFFILTKRFRNDGPVVTKAAVRKTKTTLRRMKGVVDMYNSVCKPTARRAPARRTRTSTATTLIKN